MHVGYSPLFQNFQESKSDREIFIEEMKLTDLAEPLGFDSIWQAEDHFTHHQINMNVPQFLSNVAGRTKKIKLGSISITGAWNDPIRIAEQAVFLDHLSDGRLIVGLGRGLGAKELDGLRFGMANSRVLFKESAEAIMDALREGYMDYSGTVVKQPRRDLRPRPFKSFEGRVFGTGLSPETAPVLALLGLTPMVFPLESWADIKTNLDFYAVEWRKRWPELEPPQCMVRIFCYADQDSVRAKDLGELYIGNYYQSAVAQYEPANDRLIRANGHTSSLIKGKEKKDELDVATQSFVDLMPYGTPSQITEKVKSIHEMIGNNILVVHFSFGGIPFNDAERSMRLFASDVMPSVKLINTSEPFVQIKQKRVA